VEWADMAIGVGVESASGGARHFCLKVYVRKINKMPEFFVTFALPEKYFPKFGGSVSYAYGYGTQRVKKER